MNQIIINKLRKAREENRLVLFVGAGISQYLELPNWKELIIEFCKKIGETADPSIITLIPVIESDVISLLNALEIIKPHKATVYSKKSHRY